MVNDRYDIENLYFNWLCDIVHIDQIDRSYQLLASELHRTPFIAIVEHDENRGYDGIELRDEFVREERIMPDENELNGECTVFEMLIALARRMDFITSDPYDFSDTSDKTAYWFWEMIDNLGLMDFDDDSYVRLEGNTCVGWAIDSLLRRDYDVDGDGGLFPLQYPTEDQRNVEIWYQMNAYMYEHDMK